MNRTKRWTRLIGFLAIAAATCIFVGIAQAQQKTVERVPAGPHEVQVTMHHSTVVAVEGTHMVVRRSNGQLQALEVPEDFRFHMDGRTLSVHELQPGMIVTETVTSISKPMVVKTVLIDHGTVWHISGENVVIKDKNNKLNRYRIPSWATVKINGIDQTVFELRKGMDITATIITEEPVEVVEQETRTTVTQPPEPAKPAVAEAAPEPEPQPEPRPAEPAPAPQLPAQLPGSASPLPLIGLVGLLSLAASFGLRVLGKFV